MQRLRFVVLKVFVPNRHPFFRIIVSKKFRSFSPIPEYVLFPRSMPNIRSNSSNFPDVHFSSIFEENFQLLKSRFRWLAPESHRTTELRFLVGSFRIWFDGEFPSFLEELFESIPSLIEVRSRLEVGRTPSSEPVSISIIRARTLRSFAISYHPAAESFQRFLPEYRRNHTISRYVTLS